MNTDVAVTGLNATDNPGPGLGIIRAIRAWPGFQGRVIGLAYDAKEPAAYLRDVCDAVFLIPYPSSGTDALMRRLDDVLSKVHLDLIIPSLDSELAGFQRLEPALRERGVRMFIPTREMFEARQKKRLDLLCEKAGIAYPATREITDLTQLAPLVREMGFPAVVKGVFYEAEVAHDATDLHRSAVSISSRWGFPLLVQQFVKGEEFDVSAVGDGTGGILGITSMRKMQLTAKGKAWGGMTLDDPEIVAVVRKLVRTLRWRGPLEVEIMRGEADGGLYLIEINPRFPAWIYLSHGAGCNLPGLMLEFLQGTRKNKKTIVGKPGTLFLRVAQDHICSIEEYETMAVRGEILRLVGP